MTEPLNHARRPCPVLRASYSRLIVMTTFRGYSCIVWMQEWPRGVVRCIPATCGGFLSPATNPPGIKPPQHCASPESFRLDAILRLFFCSGIRLIFTLCCASAEYYPLATVAFFLRKRPQSSLLRPGPGANCHYGSLTPTCTLLPLVQPVHDHTGKNASNAGAAKSCQKAMPSSASVI